MMFHTQGASRNSCSLLAVCGRTYEDKQEKDAAGDQRRYPFPELASSGRLEVRSLTSPKVEEFHRALDSFRPNVVYLQGEQLPSDEVGSLVWEDYELSSPEAVSRLFGSRLPTTVYLEVPNGEEVAEAIHSRGIPYVIYWKNTISCYAAAHFRQALFSVIQSSPCHTWDAFQVAHASFKLYCIDNSLVHHSGSNKVHSKSGPSLFGDPPTIDVALPEIDAEKDEDSSESSHSAIQIHEEEVCARFLVCGVACSSDAYLLGCLEDGLNALLSIEMRGSKLHNRFSAPPPPLQAGGLARGLLTMRCDMSTGSTAHISLLVSGSAQTCFDDQQLENHIKKEVVERNQLVQAVSPSDDNKSPLFEPRKSASIACDTAVFEVCVKVPSWALQVLRQLAPEASYRNLVALGIASVQGLAVASFEKEDAERLLFFSTRPGKDSQTDHLGAPSPSWLRPPQPSRKRVAPGHPRWCTQGAPAMDRETRYSRSMNGVSTPAVPERHKLKAPAMRPIPHSHLHKVIPFTGVSQQDNHEVGPVKANLSGAPSSTRHGGSGSTPIPYRKLSSNSYQAKQIISLNPIPLKKHGCGRAPIQLCSEEEFLKDVMHFLMHRGHTRLIPQSGLSEFPDAILNSKRLDLYNLYREVVSRGGFHVGNGINWKGQVFSKMRNYTSTNKMTGVGNTLKRHYETYLLEYELAHDDVDGECCLLCRSSAAGDWVNCGICGEWAHFGCDRRQGLGAFKDYAKTDGLEYICPPCSIANFKKKIPKPSNGFSEGLTYSQPV